MHYPTYAIYRRRFLNLDFTGSGAPHSEFKIPMIAGGNHTLIICHETISLLTTFVHSHNVQHRFL